MSSYSQFFRPRDPPRHTPEYQKLLKARSTKNLGVRLLEAEKTGSWETSLNVLRNMQRGNQDVRVTAWHYALVIAALLRGTSPSTPNRMRMGDMLLEYSKEGNLPRGQSLYRTLFAGYLDSEDPLGALRVLELSRKENSPFKTKKLPVVLRRLFHNLAVSGEWERALGVFAQERLQSSDAAVRQGLVLAYAHAGQWEYALCGRNEYVKDIESSKTPFEISEECVGVCEMDLHLAHALSIQGRWHIAMNILSRRKGYMAFPDESFPDRRERMRRMISGTVSYCLQHLGSKNLWKECLQLTTKLFLSHWRTVFISSEWEKIHTAVLVCTEHAGAWRQTLRYFLDFCENYESPSHAARVALSRSWLEAGNERASRNILGVQSFINASEPKQHTNSHLPVSTIRKHNALFNVDLLSDCGNDRLDSTSLPVNEFQIRHVAKSPEHTPESDMGTLSNTHVPRSLRNLSHYRSENSLSDSGRTFRSGVQGLRPPPTGIHDYASGWTYWRRQGEPVHYGMRNKYAYNLSSKFKLFPLDKKNRSWSACSPRSMGRHHLRAVY